MKFRCLLFTEACNIMSCAQGTLIRGYYNGTDHCQSNLYRLQFAVFITYSSQSALYVLLLFNLVLLKTCRTTESDHFINRQS
jgi:hypothetical protein